MGGKVWSDEENAVIKEIYPFDGAVGCQPKLPGRNIKPIQAQARKLGINNITYLRHGGLKMTHGGGQAEDEATEVDVDPEDEILEILRGAW